MSFACIPILTKIAHYYNITAFRIGNDSNSISSGINAWKHETGGEVWSSPCVGLDSTVYVGSCDRKVYALCEPVGERVDGANTGSSSGADDSGLIIDEGWIVIDDVKLRVNAMAHSLNPNAHELRKVSPQAFFVMVKNAVNS